jgi:ankyrin repeat protein
VNTLTISINFQLIYLCVPSSSILMFTSKENSLNSIQMSVSENDLISFKEKVLEHWAKFNEYPPLFVCDGKNPFLQFLFDNGIEINNVNVNKCSALHSWSTLLEPESVQFLIDQKINVNIRNIQGETPLHIASRRNCFDTIKILLENGAEIDAKDKYGNTPYDMAIEYKKYNIAEFLKNYNS